MVWPDVVVLSEPLIDCRLGLPCCCEPFGIQNFMTHRAFEAFGIAILPGSNVRLVTF